MCAHEQFEMIMIMIKDETNSYAVYKGEVNPNITAEELKVCIGVLIITATLLQAKNTSGQTAKTCITAKIAKKCTKMSSFTLTALYIYQHD